MERPPRGPGSDRRDLGEAGDPDRGRLPQPGYRREPPLGVESSGEPLDGDPGALLRVPFHLDSGSSLGPRGIHLEMAPEVRQGGRSRGHGVLTATQAGGTGSREELRRDRAAGTLAGDLAGKGGPLIPSRQALRAPHPLSAMYGGL